MASTLGQYLDSVKANLRVDFSAEKEIIAELATHVKDRFQELMESGLSEEEASENCLGVLGSARLVARQLYEAHSQGTWGQTLLASSPHLLFGALFVLNWWQGAAWLLTTLLLVISAAIYGWCHGKPVWLFPWLGYSVLPVIVAGLFLLCLPVGWSWLAILLYVPLALWFLLSIVIQTARRDWLNTTLMLLPAPVIVGWLVMAGPLGGFPEYDITRLSDFAHWIGLSFLALSLAVALFIRLRQRGLKVAVLLVAGLVTLVMMVAFADGRLSLVPFMLLMLLMLGLFLAPALLERRIRRMAESRWLNYISR